MVTPAVQRDPLTGLVTRKVIQQHLDDAIRAAGDGSVGVVRCDVDRFEWINDALGLAGGDVALQQIAALLVEACPPPAVVGRLGGDEFIIVLPQVADSDELQALARELEMRFRPAMTVELQEVFVVLSIGSSSTPRSGPEVTHEDVAELLMREAGTVLHAVKAGRRAERLGLAGADLLQLDADLHRALDRGEIVASFQPQYDARSGTLSGYEALARWHHPERGTLSPDRFIALAEADGLIHRLFDSILEQACRFAELAVSGHPLQIEVNVSAQQLAVPGLSDRIQRVLADHPNRVWTLAVEVTESALIRDQGLALTELAQVRDLGVGVSIDDFGSGYSSLAQLRDLPATELKIDRTFVEREDPTGRRLLTAIIALANGLGLTVVAEGIENGSQLRTLRELGCDRLQGMYLCPPLSAEEALGARANITDLLPADR